MKILHATVLTFISVVSMPAAHAATAWAISGTISSIYDQHAGAAASGSVLDHYTSIGLGIGQAVNFDGIVDFSRQGQITNYDGSVTVLQDIPLTKTGSYRWDGTEYDYAELQHSSVSLIDPSLIKRNLATSTTQISAGGTFLIGTLDFGGLTISNQWYNKNARVYEWTPGFDLAFDIYDGSVDIHGNATLTTFTNLEAPLPSSIFMFGPALLGLGARKLFKTPRSVNR